MLPVFSVKHNRFRRWLWVRVPPNPFFAETVAGLFFARQGNCSTVFDEFSLNWNRRHNLFDGPRMRRQSIRI